MYVPLRLLPEQLLLEQRQSRVQQQLQPQPQLEVTPPLPLLQQQKLSQPSERLEVMHHHQGALPYLWLASAACLVIYYCQTATYLGQSFPVQHILEQRCLTEALPQAQAR